MQDDSMQALFGQLSQSAWTFRHPDCSLKQSRAFERADKHASLVMDLHGFDTLSAEDAYEALLSFARLHQHRLIKIIHGRGEAVYETACNAKPLKSTAFYWPATSKKAIHIQGRFGCN